jgi:hypothetical protein
LLLATLKEPASESGRYMSYEAAALIATPEKM